jgi:nucleolar GTP-binding protein
VLYDREHYKLALGQINRIRNFINKIAGDYSRLLKYGDSLYRCKQLKRAALGRMCTMVKKITPTLAYLEQVRQHLSRLPTIDPNTRTLFLCGYPNVGKSSFMNKITRADVEVQTYAFTTRSLYVGHMDYNYLRWQVIDSPGILDRPLEDRNTIELLSITALAHLRACVLYIIDISEKCGFTLKQQTDLFHSLTPLFKNKVVLIVCNKIDILRLENLTKENRNLVEKVTSEASRISAGDLPSVTSNDEPTLLCMSTLTDIGIAEVKRTACDRLLKRRIESKLRSSLLEEVWNRIHIAQPCMENSKRQLVKRMNLHKCNAAICQDYKTITKTKCYEPMPEIFDGHNVGDFFGSDISTKLDLIEMQEENHTWQAYLLENPSEVDLNAEKQVILNVDCHYRNHVLERQRCKSSQNLAVTRVNAPFITREQKKARHG